MLRQVLCKSSSISSSSMTRRLAVAATRQQQRSYAAATSREKRALSKKQLKGETSGAPPPPPPAAAAAGSKATTAPVAGGTAAPPPPSSSSSSTSASASAGGGGGGGSSGNMLAIVGVLAFAGAGVAYSMDLIPGIGGEGSEGSEGSEGGKVDEGKDDTSKDNTSKDDTSKDDTSNKPKEVSSTDGVGGGNRVVNISLPEGETFSEPPSAVTEHPVGGNKVAMDPYPTSPSTPSSGDDTESTTTVDAALKELQSELAREASLALGEAHQELAKLVSLDLSDLDEMTSTQLKIRLVQMAKDLEERTKWEAVRLKEFLAMKEKEVEDKHILLMKKQRIEAESLMEQRLREQKNDLTAKAEQAMIEKERVLQEHVDNSLKIQEQAYEEEKSNFEKQTEEASNAKYEELYGNKLAEVKDKFAMLMETRTAQLDALTKKLNDLESALQTSKDFESGSVQAHRMSAAAIALIDRLESAEPAGAAMNALKAIASDDAVVSAALESLPPVVATKGVESLQEIQTIFEEKVYKKCRQAANVPDDQLGMEGQLLGMAFATVKFPPGPDDAAPDDDVNNSEYVLARARRHVQLGNLEQATEEMDKLTGQVAFTARDWTQIAKDRVSVEKALRVIRLECALANDTMGKAVIADS